MERARGKDAPATAQHGASTHRQTGHAFNDGPQSEWQIQILPYAAMHRLDAGVRGACATVLPPETLHRRRARTSRTLLSARAARSAQTALPRDPAACLAMYAVGKKARRFNDTYFDSIEPTHWHTSGQQRGAISVSQINQLSESCTPRSLSSLLSLWWVSTRHHTFSGDGSAEAADRDRR